MCNFGIEVLQHLAQQGKCQKNSKNTPPYCAVHSDISERTVATSPPEIFTNMEGHFAKDVPTKVEMQTLNPFTTAVRTTDIIFEFF